ncbi:MAG: hypothetical protein V4773_09660 [Verrucomicrobiota bacterium]
MAATPPLLVKIKEHDTSELPESFFGGYDDQFSVVVRAGSLWSYHGATIEFTKDSGRLPVGQATLTRPAAELAAICAGEPVAGFVDYVLRYWNGLGFEVRLTGSG